MAAVEGSDGVTAVETTEERAAAQPANGEPLVRAEGVWKVFGPGADKIVGTPDAELSRAELRQKTGCIAAVRDVSIEIFPGEVFVVMGLSGLGQVDAGAHADPPDRADRRQDHDHRPRRHAGQRRASCASCAATRSRWSSSTSGCSPTGA